MRRNRWVPAGASLLLLAAVFVPGSAPRRAPSVRPLIDRPAALATGPALRFESNDGQFDPRVRYVARAKGAVLFLSDAGATLALRASDSLLTFTVAGGRAVAPTGGDRLTNRTNYFVGPRARWRTNVQNYQSVTYESVLDGVDVVYHGEAGTLEYDVVVAPGIDPAGVVLEVGGSTGVAITSDGDLAIQTPGGRVLQPAPLVYQTVGGRRVAVRGAYRLAGPKSVAFEVASYDRARPLVIDPVLAYTTYLDANYANAVAVDAAGNAYVAGSTTDMGLGTPGTFQPSFSGLTDAYVAKLDPSGTTLVYATYLGGAVANGIAVDTTGHVYVTGETSAGFPTAHALQAADSGQVDAFVTEFSPDGAELVYSTYLGGTGDDQGYAIAIDPSGGAYVTGATGSVDFPVPNGLYAFAGGNGTLTNAFVAAIAPGGAELVYATCLGGVAHQNGTDSQGWGIAVDPDGNAYVTGVAQPGAFPLQNPAYPAVALGEVAFATEIAAGGGSLVFSTFVAANATGKRIALDSQRNVYVTGVAASASWPTKNAAQATISGMGGDVFVVKLSPSGTSVAYSTYLGGTSAELVEGIAVDATGVAYVTGWTNSTDFPSRNPLTGPTSTTGRDGQAFVTAIAPSGSSFLYSTYLDALQGDAIAVDAVGHAFVAGFADSSHLATCAARPDTLTGIENAFVVRIDRDGLSDAGASVCGLLDAPSADGAAGDGAPIDGSTGQGAELDAAVDLSDGGTRDAGGRRDGQSGAGVDMGSDMSDAAFVPPNDAGPAPVGGCQSSPSRASGSGSPLFALVFAVGLLGRRRGTGAPARSGERGLLARVAALPPGCECGAE